MTNTNTGGSAFPSHEGYTNNYGQLTARGAHEGMTLRDYFAAKAMQAAKSGHIAYYGQESNHWAVAAIASYAYEQADAMLRAREAT